MCLKYLGGGVIRLLGRNVFEVFNRGQLILNNTLTVFTMDPEPEQNPFEAPAEVPQPMMMERSLSSESGSNSSVSTVYFAKISKSGSASSSRSGSGASTSRSPPDQEVAAGLLSWPSPSLNQGQTSKDDDHPSGSTESKIIVEPSSEERKNSEEKKNESTLIIKADNSTSFDYSKPSGHPLKELEKGADKIITDIAHTETILIKEAEQAADKCCDCCCDCCRTWWRTWCSCRTSASWGCCGDVAAVLCCPLTVFSLLSCICFRCPKLFASKTAEKVRSVKGRRKAEESEFEESTDAANVDPSPPTAKHVQHHHAEHTHHHEHGEHGSGHHEEKPEATATVKSKDAEVEKGKAQGSPKMDAHRNYFFPNPEVEDDHPGSDKPAGR